MRIRTPEQLRDLMGVDWLFSDEQFQAVTAPLRPGVIIAGAGSGKTAVMAARVLWLVANGMVRPEEVLGLTFTAKATAELQQRVRESLARAGILGPHRDAEEPDEPTVSTYHSYASMLLREHGLRIGHEPDTRLIADAQRYQLAARAVARHRGPVEKLSDHPDTVIGWLLALDAELAEHLCTPERLRRYDDLERAAFAAELETSRAKADLAKAIECVDRRRELLGLVEGYRALKAELGLMDFSDQIALVARLADEHPEVGVSERQRFRVVLLDEYQDTSVAQALMLRRLYSGPSAEAGLGHAVMAVGDPNQAIYGWRGASVSNILQFNLDFPDLDGPAATYQLATNRRSDRRILHAANEIARELYDRGGNVVRLAAKPEAGEGDVRAVVHDTYDDELGWLAEQVTAAHEAAAWKEIGVLVRDNKHAADVFDALTAREIPVEIVGLKGLLRLPEVSEVLATLQLVSDVTANTALLGLLVGPRWQIGVRDLALLSRRAQELAGGRRGPRFEDVREQLTAVVGGADPIEIPALCDALESPGELDYSTEARERFALLAAELRRLRADAGEPVLDLVRRIIDLTGIDVELASSVSPAAAARRDNLDLFVRAVSDFSGIDGRTDLGALLAWLQAEDEQGQGLDVAVPSEADSVKLLTVHRSKGLEWDVVFLPGVTDTKFPSSRGRSSHVTTAAVLPPALRGDARDLAQLAGHTKDDLARFAKDRKADQQLEERRLGYVGWTRARHRLFVSCWRWRRGLKNGLGPSEYLVRTREAMAAWGGEPDAWLEAPEKGTPSPYDGEVVDLPWPIPHHTAEVGRRRLAAERVRSAGAVQPSDEELVQRWDEEIARLLEEARTERAPDIAVPLPSSLSATALARLRDDPDAFARELARPLPRPPAPAARFGTRFHTWVEQRFGQQQLIDLDELSGRGDAEIDDAELKELVEAFEAGPFADRVPLAVEPPFALVLGGQVVRGRIDAVYAEPGEHLGDPDRYLVVDWKTGRAETADPLQLAVYRVAWAELNGVEVDQVRAAFHYVRSGRTVVHDDLPGREELQRLLDPR